MKMMQLWTIGLAATMLVACGDKSATTDKEKEEPCKQRKHLKRKARLRSKPLRVAQGLIAKMPKEALECQYYIAPEENHASVVPTIMSRAIRFAYRS